MKNTGNDTFSAGKERKERDLIINIQFEKTHEPILVQSWTTCNAPPPNTYNTCIIHNVDMNICAYPGRIRGLENLFYGHSTAVSYIFVNTSLCTT